MTDTVYFANGIPANVWGAPIVMLCPLCSEPHTFGSNEHYFHCYKLTLLVDVLEDAHERSERIRLAPSWKQAKDLGRNRDVVPFDDTQIWLWDNVTALVAMLKCNMAKYLQHDDCRAWLLGTGSAPLVEHRPDPIWGDNLDGTGMNLQGKVLELVRARIRGTYMVRIS